VLPLTTTPITDPSTTEARRSERAHERAERSTRTADLFDQAAATHDPQHRSDLLDEVIIVNRTVATGIASRYRRRGIAQDDLEQAALEGLVKAVHQFDPEIRPELLTYAVPKIRGEILRWLRDQSWVVRPPRGLQELQWRIGRSIESLSQELGREPTRAEITDDLDEQEGDVEDAMRSLDRHPASLDQPVNESDVSLGDTIVGEDDGAAFDRVEELVVLGPAVRRLAQRDRDILYLRYFEGCTQRQIGERIGVTQMQVSRLLERILTNVRSEVAPPPDRRPA
jgi:RNA polymerase sigma-B factor